MRHYIIEKARNIAEKVSLPDFKASNRWIDIYVDGRKAIIQPLDLTYYRKLLFQFILARIEECTSTSAVNKSLTILKAIRWIAEAWSDVPADTIQKCFRNAGHRSPKVVLRVTNPFADFDDKSVVTDQGGWQTQQCHKATY